jgi:starch phosphorylase
MAAISLLVGAGNHARHWRGADVEAATGWAVGEEAHALAERQVDTAAQCGLPVYDKLERYVLPLFHGNRTGLIDIMRHAIALNGSFFTAQRLL